MGIGQNRPLAPGTDPAQQQSGQPGGRTVQPVAAKGAQGSGSVQTALTAAARRRRSVSAAMAPHLVVLSVTAIWGLNAVVLKVGLSHVRPVPFTAARFFAGGLFLAVVALVLRLPLWKPPPLRFV